MMKRFYALVMCGATFLFSITPAFAFVDTGADGFGSGYRVGGACYPDMQTAVDAYVTDPAHDYVSASGVVPTLPSCQYVAPADGMAFGAALGGAVLLAWLTAWTFVLLRRVL